MAEEMGRELKGSVYENEIELMRDVTVDLAQENGTWGGSFELKHARRHIKQGASYWLKLEDGRSGTISIVDFDETPGSSDPWVSFRGSGTLL
jgi:hypothetical protein